MSLCIKINQVMAIRAIFKALRVVLKYAKLSHKIIVVLNTFVHKTITKSFKVM